MIYDSGFFAGLTASLKQFGRKATLACTEVSKAESGMMQLLRWKHWYISGRKSPYSLAYKAIT